MAWSRNEIDITWASAATKSVAAAADEASDDVTLTAGPWKREIMANVNNSGTPASGDIVRLYWQAKSDPGNTGTPRYAKQLTLIGVLDTYGNDSFGDAKDDAAGVFPLSSEFATGRLVAVSAAASNAIVVSAVLTETIYS